MIIEDYVTFEIAILLRKKGFDIPCEFQYINCASGVPFLIDKRDESGCYYKNSEIGDDEYSAPTLQQAMKWLREIHKTDICVCRELDEYGDCFDGYMAVVYSNKIYRVTIRDVEKDLSFEEAAEAAIKYCLTNLI